METHLKKMLTSRSLCERYNVVDRTIDRWVQAEILPRPVRINGRRYWDQDELEKIERERMAAREADTAA